VIELRQFEEMLALQEQLETHINGADWRKQDHDYALCIMMECTEIVNHWGWKHWKDTDKVPNNKAIQMELVDVWHFILAYMLQNDLPDPEAVYDILVTANDEIVNTSDYDMIRLALGFGMTVLVNKGIAFGGFVSMMRLVGMDFDLLYRLYIGKRELNKFRADNGYKEGTYKKIWGNREDNEHLLEICNIQMTKQEIYNTLQFRYDMLCA
jgi:dimeric dUTPase (all-alpha-NTP-PPase superfamily)